LKQWICEVFCSAGEIVNTAFLFAAVHHAHIIGLTEMVELRQFGRNGIEQYGNFHLAVGVYRMDISISIRVPVLHYNIIPGRHE
jgi:hypothetical protein